MSTEQHRPIYVVVTAIAVVFFLALRFFGEIGTYAAYGYPLMALYLTWSLWALLRGRIRVKVLVTVSFWALTLFWVGRMISPFFLGEDPMFDVEQSGARLFAVFIVLCILAHLLFRTRTALVASGMIFAATTASRGLWIVFQVQSGRSVSHLVDFLAYEALLVIAILLLYALAKSKDEHAGALVEAERMRGFAYVDALTGLPNRRRVEEDFERYLGLAERGERPASVVMLDIDGFKPINDTHGHQLGDEILVEIGRIVPPALRASDVFGRWGGEEFIIVVPGGNDDAAALADRVRRVIAGHAFPKGVRVTASFGVATWTTGTTMDELIRRADERLYEVKASGGDRVAREGTAT